MKIKVGDITIQEKHNICKKSICSECPLYVHDLRPFILHDVCAAGYPADYDLVVDFPEDCVDWDTRLHKGVKEAIINSIGLDKEEEKMGDLLFSQRLYLENEYYKWKEELDDKAGCVTLDCPMLMVSFLQDHGYINVNKVIEDWRLKENEN